MIDILSFIRRVVADLAIIIGEIPSKQRNHIWWLEVISLVLFIIIIAYYMMKL